MPRHFSTRKTLLILVVFWDRLLHTLEEALCLACNDQQSVDC